MAENPKKYYNHNPYPAILPTKNGGDRTFRTGESTTDPWFSRFVKSGQLRETEIGSPIPTQTPKLVSPPIPNRVPQPVVADTTVMRGCSISCQGVCEVSCQDACESTTQTVEAYPTHTLIGLRYYCKFCDWVLDKREGAERDIVGHMTSYHKAELARIKLIEDSIPKEPTGPNGGDLAENSTLGPMGGTPTETNSALYEQVKKSGTKLEEDDLYLFKFDSKYFCKQCVYSCGGKGALMRHIHREHPKSSPSH